MRFVNNMLESVQPHRDTVDSSESEDVSILPVLNRSSLVLFDLRSGQTASATLPISFTFDAVFCLLNAEQLLCVGGNPPVATAYILTLSDFHIAQIEPMRMERGMPGIIKHGDSVFVFGGWNFERDSSACEKFTILSQTWTPLPSMHQPRYCFSPCKHSEEILLPCLRACTQTVVETFTISTEQFRLIPISLEREGDLNSFAFVVEDELVIIADEGLILRWKIHAETEFRVSYLDVNALQAVSRMPPIRRGREIVWVSYSNPGIRRFDLDTQSISSRVTDE